MSIHCKINTIAISFPNVISKFFLLDTYTRLLILFTLREFKFKTANNLYPKRDRTKGTLC